MIILFCEVFYLTPAVGSLDAILGDISSVVTSALTWVGSFVSTIASTPLLLIFFIVGFVGLGISLIRRIIR